MQGYCDIFSKDYFEADVDRSTCLHATPSKVEHFDVSNVIYHKFSHGAVFYTLIGENVNIMLEFLLKYVVQPQLNRHCVAIQGTMPFVYLQDVNIHVYQ